MSYTAALQISPQRSVAPEQPAAGMPPRPGEFASLIHEAGQQPAASAFGNPDAQANSPKPAADRNVGATRRVTAAARGSKKTSAKEDKTGGPCAPSLWPAAIQLPAPSQIAKLDPAMEEVGGDSQSASSSLRAELHEAVAPRANDSEPNASSNSALRTTSLADPFRQLDQETGRFKQGAGRASSPCFAGHSAGTGDEAGSATDSGILEWALDQEDRDGVAGASSPTFESPVASPPQPLASAMEERLPKLDSPISTGPALGYLEVSPADDSETSASRKSALPNSALRTPIEGKAPPAFVSPDQVPDSVESPGGMSPALPLNTMQIAQEVDESSRRTEQILPWSKAGTDSHQAAAQAGAGEDLTARTSSAAELEGAHRTGGTPAPLAAEAAIMMGYRPADPELAAPAVTPARAAEVIGRTIENSVVGFQHAGASSLSVVLRPDSNTQLSLHFKLERGQVEALAILERGDFKALNAGWTQLQSRLADQGIRLASLASTSRAPTSSGGQFSSPNERQNHQPAVDVPQPQTAPLPARKSGAPVRRFATEREWWA